MSLYINYWLLLFPYIITTGLNRSKWAHTKHILFVAKIQKKKPTFWKTSIKHCKKQNQQKFTANFIIFPPFNVQPTSSTKQNTCIWPPKRRYQNFPFYSQSDSFKQTPHTSTTHGLKRIFKLHCLKKFKNSLNCIHLITWQKNLTTTIDSQLTESHSLYSTRIVGAVSKLGVSTVQSFSKLMYSPCISIRGVAR